MSYSIPKPKKIKVTTTNRRRTGSRRRRHAEEIRSGRENKEASKSSCSFTLDEMSFDLSCPLDDHSPVLFYRSCVLIIVTQQTQNRVLVHVSLGNDGPRGAAGAVGLLQFESFDLLLLVSDDAFTLLQFGQKLRDTQLQTAGVSGLYYGALRLDLYKLRPQALEFLVFLLS